MIATEVLMLSREQGAAGETLVRFEGVLDASAAREVRAVLGEEHTRLVLDFSHATRVDYYGLSTLVAELLRAGRSVTLRGLRVRDERMLRYFGYPLPQRDAGDGAEHVVS